MACCLQLWRNFWNIELPLKNYGDTQMEVFQKLAVFRGSLMMNCSQIYKKYVISMLARFVNIICPVRNKLWKFTCWLVKWYQWTGYLYQNSINILKLVIDTQCKFILFMEIGLPEGCRQFKWCVILKKYGKEIKYRIKLYQFKFVEWL